MGFIFEINFIGPDPILSYSPLIIAIMGAAKWSPISCPPILKIH
jgi:hypothetical protein